MNRLSPMVDPLFRRLVLPLLLIGSFAQTANAACGGTSNVSDQDELFAAINAFNAVAAGPCVFTIEPTADIALSSPTFGGPQFPVIQNDTAGVSLVIEGNNTRVFGNGTDGIRPFQVAVNTFVTINDLTISEGRMNADLFASRGAGILNEGTLTLNRVSLLHNVSGNAGGGLYNQNGFVEINDSTIAYNEANGASNGGGGIFTTGGSLTLRNTTISTNSANANSGTAGGVYGDGAMDFDSVTIWGNVINGSGDGNGIFLADNPAAVLTITNSIISNNGPFDCQIGANAVVNDLGYNLASSLNCGLSAGTSITGGSANLLPLADNGGPTLTHLPTLTSPGVDAGLTSLTTDQRGEPRPQGPGHDIGAVEGAPCADNSTFGVATFSELEAAISCFNSKTAPGAYTIQFSGSISATHSTETIDNSTAGVSLVIDGVGQGLGGAGLFGVRALDIAAGTSVTLQDIRVAGGLFSALTATENETGAGIRNAGQLTLLRSGVDRGEAVNGTGGIANLTGATLEIIDSTIKDNLATGTGAGAIENQAGASLTITNSTISGNRTDGGAGGGLWNAGALTLDSVTIHNNQASTGGGIYLGGTALVSIRNSLIAGNLVGTDCHLAAGSVTSAGFNLVTAPGTCGFVNGVNNDIVGLDPMIDGGLKWAGGTTLTHLLLPGSPAIDAGDTSLTVDQRGFARPVGGVDDIGAVEMTQLGRITIRKEITPLDGRHFPFTLSGPALVVPIPFELTGFVTGNPIPRQESFDLSAGTYRVTESVDSQWAPDSIICTGSPGTAVPDVPSASVDVDLQAGDDITCTFYNVETVADLSVTLTDSPDPVRPGEQLTYLATINNAGPNDARQVSLVFPRPLGTSIISATADGGGSCAISPTEVVCEWAAAVTRTATIVAGVNADVIPGSVINSTATVSSLFTPDAMAGNDSATADTMVADESVGSPVTQVIRNVPALNKWAMIAILMLLGVMGAVALRRETRGVR